MHDSPFVIKHTDIKLLVKKKEVESMGGGVNVKYLIYDTHKDQGFKQEETFLQFSICLKEQL